MDLFENAMNERMTHEAPLAARLRPRNLDEVIGQEHIVGKGKLLRRLSKRTGYSLRSSLWPSGHRKKPPWPQVIASHTQAHFESISAVLAGVAELRRVIAEATERRKMHGKRTILFIDEVHRWNKAQQDALLPHVETGIITLIGATTENPFFDVIKALVSRSRIFELHPLTEDELARILDRALSDPDRGYGNRSVQLDRTLSITWWISPPGMRAML